MWEQVNSTVRYAKAATAIGVVTHGERALLVDSGLDENLVRKVVNGLEREGVRVAAIVNTHAHADHFGGNAWACKRTGCRVIAPAGEAPFVEQPSLEGWTLFGAPAPRALQGKFILAAQSPVHERVAEEGARTIEGFDVRFHALPGHSVHQMGVEVDGVLFTGDALLPESIVSKYGLVFAVDPEASRASTRRLLDLPCEHVVSYHGGIVNDLAAQVRHNVEANEAVEREVLLALRRGPATTDEVVTAVFDKVGAPPTLELHALNAATVRAYLAGLERAGHAEAALDGPRLTWRAKTP